MIVVCCFKAARNLGPFIVNVDSELQGISLGDVLHADYVVLIRKNGKWDLYNSDDILRIADEEDF